MPTADMPLSATAAAAAATTSPCRIGRQATRWTPAAGRLHTRTARRLQSCMPMTSHSPPNSHYMGGHRRPKVSWLVTLKDEVDPAVRPFTQHNHRPSGTDLNRFE